MAIKSGCMYYVWIDDTKCICRNFQPFLQGWNYGLLYIIHFGIDALNHFMFERTKSATTIIQNGSRKPVGDIMHTVYFRWIMHFGDVTMDSFSTATL